MLINKKIGVFGLGKSGLATLNFLNSMNAEFIAWDDNETSRSQAASFAMELKDLSDPAWQKIDFLILSPGIPTNYPTPHQVVQIAQNANAKIICDIELLYNANPNAKYIGITGTNGKSTTTSLIAHILKSNDIETEMGGNIGIAALDLKSLGPNGVYVLEMSSFQLELLERTHFNISVLLNITPDHLDRHETMENYIKAKLNIFNNMVPSDVAIINFDDPVTNRIYHQLLDINTIKTIAISTKTKLQYGISVIDNILYNTIDNTEWELGTLTHLRGRHNAENLAAAYATAYFYGLDSNLIIKAIQSFKGLPHRMEYVGEKNNITFINDSKGTNAEATEKALLSFSDNIYWILGGANKEGGITTLIPLFNRIKHAFLIGKATEEFAETLKGKVNFTKCETLENAVNEAYKMASQDNIQEKVILLSPACASYDQWKNFEERGEYFVRKVKKF